MAKTREENLEISENSTVHFFKRNSFFFYFIQNFAKTLLNSVNLSIYYKCPNSSP